MKVLGVVLVMLSMASNTVESCQLELVQNAASLITVGYDRHRSTAVYVDTLNVEMKKKKKFQSLLAASCNSRRDVTLTIEIRKEGQDEWQELARDIKITAKKYDDYKELDPCSRYEIKIIAIPRAVGVQQELPIFTVGPLHELDPADMEIAKFKGDGEQYYTDHFKAEYIDVTDKSFTIRWEPICALGIKVFVKGEEEDWEEEPRERINNDIKDPTTQLKFDVMPCKVYEVEFEFFIDSAGQERFDRELPNIKIAIEKNDLKHKFSHYSFDDDSKILKWNYTGLLEDLECVESFSYRLLKEENGDIEQLFDGDDQDDKENKFDVKPLLSECNFGLKMEVEFIFLEDNQDSIHAFEEHIRHKDQKENIITFNESDVMYEISPCIPPGSELFIGLTEITEEDQDVEGIIPETKLVGRVPIDESGTALPVSVFEKIGLNSCNAYQMRLLRKIDDNFQELDKIEFRNPKWHIWKSPSLHLENSSETAISLNIADHETNGSCPVSSYDVKCYETGATSPLEPTVYDSLQLSNLSPGTRYNCTGRIVHKIMGADNLETPWAEYIILETTATDIAGVEAGSISQPLEMVPKTSSSTPTILTKTIFAIMILLI